MGLTVGSLFSGIGGFDLGLERAGMRVLWQVEIDPFCRAVLEKHWPNVARYMDVRRIHANNAPRVDVLCGGFPCQDLSFAGRGAGIDGPRSGLWTEFARLISDFRPKYVVVENVPALLVRGLGRVLGDLAARGYDAEWDCLPASAFGAHHRRDRIWIVAYPQYRGWDTGGESAGPSQDASASHRSSTTLADSHGEWQSEPQGIKRDESRWIANGGQELADPDRSGQRERWRAFPIQAQFASVERGRQAVFPDADREPLGRITESWGQRDHWIIEPDVGRVADGVPARVDRLRGLGNAIVPQIAEWIGRRILRAETMTDD